MDARLLNQLQQDAPLQYTMRWFESRISRIQKSSFQLHARDKIEELKWEKSPVARTRRSVRRWGIRITAQALRSRPLELACVWLCPPALRLHYTGRLACWQ